MDAIMVSANEETESLSQLRTLHYHVAVRGNKYSHNLKLQMNAKHSIKCCIVSYAVLFFYRSTTTAQQDYQMYNVNIA